MSPDQIVQQFQQIVDTLKRTIEASADLSERVEVLERDSGNATGLLISLQGNLQILLDQYQTQAEAQNKFHENLNASLSQLEVRIAILESPS
jgi:hypothetical protein